MGWNPQKCNQNSKIAIFQPIGLFFAWGDDFAPQEDPPTQFFNFHPKSQPRYRLRHRGLLKFAWREKINWVKRVHASAKSGFHFSLNDKKRQTHTNLWRGQAQKSRFWVTSDTIKASFVHLTHIFWYCTCIYKYIFATRTWNKSSKSYLSLLSYTYRNPAEQTPE